MKNDPETSSGVRMKPGDRIKGYEILEKPDLKKDEDHIEVGNYAFSGKARAPNGRTVFFKKYRSPGSSAAWFDEFVVYQNDLKQRIQNNPAAKNLCYEFIEFFTLKKQGKYVPLRAFYQVFEWVEGGEDLSETLGKLGSYSWGQRVIFARVMLAGVNALHRAGIIHTDLKPENIYLLPEPAIAAKYKLRIIDLDFSLIEGKRAPWDGDIGYIGSHGYMSPEHFAPKVPQKCSDVFTLGLILSELLGAGHPAVSCIVLDRKGKRSFDNVAYGNLIKEEKLPPVQIQKPIENVADLDFLNDVINSCFRIEGRSRPTAEQVLQALNGRLAEWDGKRPKGSVTISTPVRPTPAMPVAPVRAPAPPPPVATTGVVLIGPSGKKLQLNIATKLGRTLFRSWGDDFGAFMSPEQFHLYKDTSGGWMIEHCAPAKNITNANGQPITTPLRLESGMVISLGKTGKCPITVKMS